MHVAESFITLTTKQPSYLPRSVIVIYAQPTNPAAAFVKSVSGLDCPQFVQVLVSMFVSLSDSTA